QPRMRKPSCPEVTTAICGVWREVLVAGHHRGRVKVGRWRAGAQHVDAVEGGFGVDAGVVAAEAKRGAGDHGAEVLAHLVVVDHFPPTAIPMSSAPVCRPAATRSTMGVS